MTQRHLMPTSRRETPFLGMRSNFWVISLVATAVLIAAWWLVPSLNARWRGERNTRQFPALFGATIPNPAPAPQPAPAGMVWIPGGEFSMGAADAPADDALGMRATADSRPVHRVYVDAFF